MPETTYPCGWEYDELTMAEMQVKYGPDMEPEYARRLWSWLESEGGRIGIGGGKRSIPYALKLWLSDPSRYANPKNSWHCKQKWLSGESYYAAVDLVVRVKGKKHRSPTWEEGDSAKKYGLHAFIRRNGKNPEPWHLQAIIASFGYQAYGEGKQIRSASQWRKAGRPSLRRWPLPTEGSPPVVPTPGGSVVQVTVQTVRKGDKGPWVLKLQALLPTFGLDTGSLDSDFGPRTEYATKVFQDRNGLESDGIVGPLTWAVLLGTAPVFE
jgi:hypothetical protein